MLKITVSFIMLASIAGVVIGDLKCDDICQVDKLEIYGPVCGSDGKTYDTECALKIAVCESKIPVSIVYHGKCKYSGDQCLNSIPCHLDKVHICGSDTIPYINECAMRKHACKEKQAKIGVKIGSDCNNCPTCKGEGGKPVCGSDHKTYKSKCALRAAACDKKEAIIVLKEGSCEKGKAQPEGGESIDELFGDDDEANPIEDQENPNEDQENPDDDEEIPDEDGENLLEES